MSDDGNNVIDSLISADVLAESRTDGIQLADEFRTDWRLRINLINNGQSKRHLAQLLAVTAESLTIIKNKDGRIVAQTSGEQIGQWPSKIAMAADIAAFDCIQEWYSNWGDLTGTERDELIARLRMFLDTCPECGEELSTEEPTDSDHSPTYLFCPDCGSVIFEFDSGV